MILVDTSVWVDHFRRVDSVLSEVLQIGDVLVHPFVVGEIALGHLRNAHAILNALQRLPQPRIATHYEVLNFISRNALAGLGIGYVDVHLIAAARLTAGTTLWTRDKRLLAVAKRLDLAANL